MIDLRSDTFTRPGKGMLNAMLNASVGDDVFGEDPTVNALEERVASLFGMDAALFCPSGTQTNQIAIKCHTRPADEVICDHSSHVYIYEGGGIAFNSGCQVRPIQGERGKITAAQVLEAINPDDVHKPVSRLVCIENTSNRGGGSCYTTNQMQEIRDVCDAHQMALHLDGARIWNAITAGSGTPQWYGRTFHSISVCLSKGLGAPVGSVLIGSKSFIHQARRIRKVMGGGMRQAGYLAAAGLYALENNTDRLAEDHAHAHQIAEALIAQSFIGRILPVETNIIIFEVLPPYSPAKFVEHMLSHNILCLAISPTQVRMVTHLDVSQPMIEKVVEVIKNM
ncbi:MAG TPA: GntG family PLP-dependent aldolase [Ferruginibacter sp.]|nr:GntG family PLP-dependent aldolase [Ferruginibacter sp.]HRN90888.1 GntG family PLP-dependent aldolase [Ferruginibacter sp.]HRO05362.1 GntG family PLP-dependent aldolase [Ferruginibacter sp.]HRO96434.1 GntG family PLP-dependent aldolase [Ferruginibacter sp.]HRP48540.1 GntG family PLP-dependent aldolase [Ferruginibacter sp.]